MSAVVRYVCISILLAPFTPRCFASPPSAPATVNAVSSGRQAQVVAEYGKLPLSFEPNRGQAGPETKFLSRGDGYSLSLNSTEAVLSLHGKSCIQQPHDRWNSAQSIRKSQPCDNAAPPAVLHVKLIDSNPNAEVGAEQELPGKSNYFKDKDATNWHTGISNYRRVQYHGIYPGIDLVYYGNQRQLEHDFIVAPGTDPRSIQLRFSGAQHVSLSHDGDLAIATANGTLELHRPIIYQQIADARVSISGGYTLNKENQVGFAVGKYDRSVPLIIDPVMVYSTYFGGPNGGGSPTGIALDSQGNAYITGTTTSDDFPLQDPILSSGPTADRESAFISKLNAEGTALLYSTYFGPSSAAEPSAIAVDAQGNAYITGTAQAGLPLVNALQTQAGQINAFVSKISADGSKLLYSTYLGGTYAVGTSIAVDAGGGAYIGGFAEVGFPTKNALFPEGPGFVSGFLAKLAPSGLSLDYATYMKGTDQIASVAVDALGEAIVVGVTSSPDFPLVNALFPGCTIPPGNTVCAPVEVFAAKFNAAGTTLVYSTPLLKGFGVVATNAAGDAFITGLAYPGTLPAVNALYPSAAGANAFALRLNPSGSALIYSTYLGTAGSSTGSSIAVDADDNAYVTGSSAADFPLVNALQSARHGTTDAEAFVTKINGDGSALVYSTYLGGSGEDYASGIAVDAAGNAYIAGQTKSQDFPAVNPLQRRLSTPGRFNSADGFVAKISAPNPTFSITNTVDRAVAGPNGDLSYTITVTNIGSSASSPTVIDKAVRENLRGCQVSTGEFCDFRKQYSTATVSLSEIAPGESKTIFIQASVSETAGDYNSVSNVATVYSGAAVLEEASASAPVTVRLKANIAVTASVADITNGQIHYVYKVSNLGPDNAHAVLFRNPLSSPLSFVSATTTEGDCILHPTLGSYGLVRCRLGNQEAGKTVQIDVILTAFITSCPTVTNTATVSSQSSDVTSSDDLVTLVTPLPASVCTPPTLPTPAYQIRYFDYHFSPDSYTPRLLNNNGDLVAYVGILKSGATTPIATGLIPVSFNDSDQVLGVGNLPVYELYEKGSAHALDFGPQFPKATPFAINNAGDIAGLSGPEESIQSLFIRQNGVTRGLGHFSPRFFGVSMNGKGEIIAWSLAGKNTQSLLATHGLILDIAPNYRGSRPSGIDSSGRVLAAGVPHGDNRGHVFIYSGGKVNDLGALGGDEGVNATGINDCGEVVGYTFANSTAFLYTHGGFVDLNTVPGLPKHTSIESISINNQGQILGLLYDPSIGGAGYVLLTPPVPEKCGSDATIDNTPDSAAVTAGGTITYTIKVKNLDTATTHFTVADALATTTDFVACNVAGAGGNCSYSAATHTLYANFPNLAKGSTGTITVQAKATGNVAAKSIIMNTATLSSSATADYLSTAYTTVP